MAALKRAGYRDAVNFIAENDEPRETELAEIIGTPTVVLVASIFGTTQERVAADVVRERAKLGSRGPCSTR